MILQDIWNDPVWSKVIAGVIVSILATVLAYFKGWYPKLTTRHKLTRNEQEVLVITPLDINTINQTCDMSANDAFRIITELDELPPLLVNDVRQSYIGLNVNWLTEYSFASKKNASLILVSLLLLPVTLPPILVYCTVKLSEYKRFSILKKKAKIRVTGNIASIISNSFELSNVKLYFEQDGDAHQGEIREKENQLRQLQGQLTALNTLIEDSDLVCPKCKAPLVTRASHTIYGPGDIDVDIEYLEYECGLSIDGGTEKSPCRSSRARP